MICPECGEPIEGIRKFCDRCGAALPEKPIDPKWLNPADLESKPTLSSFKKMEEKSNLGLDRGLNVVQAAAINVKLDGLGRVFDNSHLIYLLPISQNRGDITEIRDDHGRLIGKLTRQTSSIRRIFEFQEITGQIVAVIHHKIVGIPPVYELKDNFDVVLGKIPKPLLSLFSPKFQLIDPLNHPELIATGNFRAMNFDIAYVTNTQMPIAQVRPLINVRNWITVDIDRLEKVCVVKLIDPNADRKKILALVLSVQDILHI